MRRQKGKHFGAASPTMHVTMDTAFFTPRGSGLLKLSFHFWAFSSSMSMFGAEGSG